MRPGHGALVHGRLTPARITPRPWFKTGASVNSGDGRDADSRRRHRERVACGPAAEATQSASSKSLPCARSPSSMATRSSSCECGCRRRGANSDREGAGGSTLETHEMSSSTSAITRAIRSASASRACLLPAGSSSDLDGRLEPNRRFSGSRYPPCESECRTFFRSRKNERWHPVFQ